VSKNILLGVTGSVAAIKSAELALSLVQNKYSVKVILTQNATRFISLQTFKSLSIDEVYFDEQPADNDMKHIKLSNWADIVLIAPATANTIAKIVGGFANNLLSTTVLALSQNKPRFIAPAMNTAMFENIATQSNIEVLEQRGFNIIQPVEASLACGEIGIGAMASKDEIIHKISLI